MRVRELTVDTHEHGARLTGTIDQARSSGSVALYFDYHLRDPTFVGSAADALAVALLLPCMRADEPLEMPAPVSPRLCFNLPRIRDIFHTWWPGLAARIPIRISPATLDPRPPPSRAATFFSGGVDSFYTLLKHRRGVGSLPAPLTHVLFMRGVETRLEGTRGVDETEKSVRDVAAAEGVECIIGESSIRTTLQGPEGHLHWERHYHGSALAAAALALSPGFAYACIPSSFSYNHLIAHGSTPLVDEMFSSDRLQIVHDGADTSRPSKVARILEWDRDLALRHLRVCIWNSGGAFNCGQCYKCVRTAVPLRVLGVWDQARTFPNKDTGHWEDSIAQDHAAFIEENLRFAREHGAERELIATLKRGLRRRRRTDRLITLLKTPPFSRLMPLALRVRDKLGACACVA